MQKSKRVFLINLIVFIGMLVLGILKFFSFFIPKGNKIIKINLDSLKNGVNEFAKDSIIIIRENSKLKVLDAICTHLGCKVKFIPQEKIFRCPCHKSMFDLNGRVIKGPAKKNLKVLKYKVKNNKIIIFV